MICVLYDDPIGGSPFVCARNHSAHRGCYGGQTTPTPERIDFERGQLVGSVSGELGLRKVLTERGHRLVVIADKEDPGSVFERELKEAEIVISQPFGLRTCQPNDRQCSHLRLAITAVNRI